MRAILDHEEALARLRIEGAAPAKLIERAARRFTELGMSVWSARTAALAPGPSRGRDGLSRRVAVVLRLLASGLTNRQIAERLVLSVHTVERHVNNAYRKIGAHNRADAAAYAVRYEL
jgi:DNA-binding NarL/FixJ family response regulator